MNEVFTIRPDFARYGVQSREISLPTEWQRPFKLNQATLSNTQRTGLRRNTGIPAPSHFAGNLLTSDGLLQVLGGLDNGTSEEDGDAGPAAETAMGWSKYSKSNTKMPKDSILRLHHTNGEHSMTSSVTKVYMCGRTLKKAGTFEEASAKARNFGHHGDYNHDWNLPMPTGDISNKVALAWSSKGTATESSPVNIMMRNISASLMLPMKEAKANTPMQQAEIRAALSIAFLSNYKDKTETERDPKGLHRRNNGQDASSIWQVLSGVSFTVDECKRAPQQKVREAYIIPQSHNDSDKAAVAGSDPYLINPFELDGLCDPFGPFDALSSLDSIGSLRLGSMEMRLMEDFVNDGDQVINSVPSLGRDNAGSSLHHQQPHDVVALVSALDPDTDFNALTEGLFDEFSHILGGNQSSNNDVLSLSPSRNSQGRNWLGFDTPEAESLILSSQKYNYQPHKGLVMLDPREVQKSTNANTPFNMPQLIPPPEPIQIPPALFPSAVPSAAPQGHLLETASLGIPRAVVKRARPEVSTQPAADLHDGTPVWSVDAAAAVLDQSINAGMERRLIEFTTEGSEMIKKLSAMVDAQNLVINKQANDLTKQADDLNFIKAQLNQVLQLISSQQPHVAVAALGFVHDDAGPAAKKGRTSSEELVSLY